VRRLDEPFHRLRICVPLNTSDIIAFVATTNPERARIFYENVLGLALLADEPAALVFEANGVMLRVAKVLRLDPAAHTVLGWLRRARSGRDGSLAFARRGTGRLVQGPGRRRAVAHPAQRVTRG